MKYRHLYTLILMSVFHTSCGQNQTARSKENLSQVVIGPATQHTPASNVWDIMQDRSGNIWFATSDGVFRYDGNSYTKITEKLISEPFFSIFEDSRGNFWFGTYGSGLFYYHEKTLPSAQAGFRHFTTKDGLADNSVFPIYEDKAGIIWLGTGGGVSRYDGKSFRNFTTSGGLSNNDVHAIVQDKTGKMWFGSRGELSVYDGKTFTTVTDKNGKTFRNVWAMIKDKNGNIWFGADGLWRYGGSTFTQIDQTGAGVIIQDKKGNVFASQGGPIFRYDANSLSDKNPRVTVINTKREGLRNLPFGILAANDGSIWIGSDHYSFDGKVLRGFKSEEGRK